MAAIPNSMSTTLMSFFPRVFGSNAALSSRYITAMSSRLSYPLLAPLAIGIPSAFQLKLPTLLGDLWESVLRAVPKKKTSYMKKRSRLLAGKGLKDVTSLNRCSACGHMKRAHVLCPYCVKEIQDMFRSKFAKLTGKTTTEKP